MSDRVFVASIAAFGVIVSGACVAAIRSRNVDQPSKGVVVVSPAALSASVGRQEPVRASQAEPVEVFFTGTTAEMENPERGFYSWGNERLDRLTEGDVTDAAAKKQRLLFVLLRLDSYRNANLPSSYLSSLQNGFSRARAGGVKLVVRAVYNYPANETEYQGAKDASLSRIISHLNQLKPLFSKNSDVIAFFQAGFVGAWGEWHTSSNNLTTTTGRTQVKDAILAAVPPTRFVQFRYPAHLMSWTPTLPIAESALDGRFRMGFHNDCFLASATDVGTYDEDDALRSRQRNYAARLTELAPFGGETCNPADEPGAVARSSCADILAEGARYHLTYLNEDYHRELFHDQWQRNGCLSEVRKKMGYRFELVRASHANSASRGASFGISLDVRNNGWARLYNPRSLQILLLNPVTNKVRRLDATGVDPRRWLPAALAAQQQATIKIPSDLAPGSYRVLLALPDPSTNLSGDGRFAIRFANSDAGAQRWDAALAAFSTGTTVTVN